MKNTIKWFGIIALVAVIGFTMAACPGDDGGGNNSPKTVKYESTDTAGYTYILTVTENTARAAYIAVAGDSYVLTIKKTGEPDKVSKGTVSGIGTDGTLTLQPSSAGSATFSVSVTGGQISAITGAVTLENGTTVTAGDFAKGNGNNVETFTSIAAMATWLSGQPANTAATAYAVKLNVSDLGGSGVDTGSVGYVLNANATKYVSLDLSGSTITSIGYGAFELGDDGGCTSLTGIIIPGNVTSIGNFAFHGCTNLASIIIPDSVTSIGAYAFRDTAWLNSKPDGVVYAGKVVCLYKGTMPANTSITITDGTKAIASSAFSNCTNLISVTIPDSVTSIGQNAFFGTRLTSITIPDSVTGIGQNAFSSCTALVSVTFEGTITEANFNSPAFPGDLRDKYLDATNGGIGTYTTTAPVSSNSVWTKQGGGEPSAPPVFTSIADMTAWLAAQPANTAATAYTVKLNVSNHGSGSSTAGSAGAALIANNTKYVNLDLSGSTMQGITDYAFKDCTSLTGITIPGSITDIDASDVFANCPSLTSVTFQATWVTGEEGRIYSGAFPGDLRDKYLDATNGGIGTYTTTAPMSNNSVWIKQQ